MCRFSRKVIWFTLASSNNDPRLVSRYYLEAVEQINGIIINITIICYTCAMSGCPTIVRADFGTENCLTAKAQIAFRLHDTDAFGGERSFIYGPSTANIVSVYTSLLSMTMNIHNPSAC